jgi:hypothetical protein
MIGAKKAEPKVTKATTALGVLESFKQSVTKQLNLGGGRGAGAEPNWNAIKAAREMQARQNIETEKYRALVRRY